MTLDEVLERLVALPEDKLAALKASVVGATAERKFIPSPGPQTDAWRSRADLLLYGGEAGGGKSGLLCGLALETHRRSLLMRRQYSDLQGGGGLIEMLLGMHGSRDGFNGSSPATLRSGERIVTFGACKNLGDERDYMGRARDLLGIDEAAQFLETQVRLLMGWVRSEVEGQRTRTVLATNPPLDSVGEWIIGMFRPWLDLTHPHPAKPGELRWYITTPEGKDLEVDGPERVQRDGREFEPTSRTFIPAALSDNPFLTGTGYEKTLDALPEPYRSALRDGNFMLARRDQERQVIPTDWIRQAQARWTPELPKHAPMSAIAVDVAQGGIDQTVLSARYDGWYAELVAEDGKSTPDGPTIAAMVVQHRRNGCPVVIDMGGGYGGSAKDHLDQNDIKVTPYNGANRSVRRTADGLLGFVNMRAEAYWRFREALDPSQEHGSPIALPEDSIMVSDLAAATFRLTPRGIQIEEKDAIKVKLGRSPDRGDAVVMSWFGGPKLETHATAWRKFRETSPTFGGEVTAHMGYAARRRGRNG